MSTQNARPPSQDAPKPTDQEVEDELCLLDLEDADSLLEHVQDLISQNLDDFPEDQIDDEAARFASRMSKASITEGTRNGHVRIIKHFICFHLRRNKLWDAKRGGYTKLVPHALFLIGLNLRRQRLLPASITQLLRTSFPLPLIISLDPISGEAEPRAARRGGTSGDDEGEENDGGGADDAKYW
ncbi:hypothetical protein R3P38DRAFT_2772226 [Favolaschia claudopus]|uniref:Uncharacterized protein n=1 Tax=Favolaschia claudopus TaxID=2862362 RepID=A0AAW0C4Y5_9AGAR